MNDTAVIAGEKAKRRARSLPQEFLESPVACKRQSAEIVDETDSNSSKLAFVVPQKKKVAPRDEPRSASPSVVSSSGEVIQVPQRCARKSSDSMLDFQTGNGVLKPPARRQALSLSCSDQVMTVVFLSLS